MHRSVKSMRRQPLIGMGALAAGLALASVAVAAPYNPAELSGTQIGQVDRACQSVIGLEPGEAQYAACVASLSNSVRVADDGRSLVDARRACRHGGFGRDTSGLAECTLRSSTETTPADVSAAASAPRAPAAGSYFESSRREVYRREQNACASLGFDPTGDGFASCLTGVRSAIMVANNPD